jgi:oxygen-dependent protoporphyrinogen oxidase
MPLPYGLSVWCATPAWATTSSIDRCAAGLILGGDTVEMPTGLVMGVPTDLSALARSRVLSSRTMAQLPLDHVRPGHGRRRRLARRPSGAGSAEVVDRLVSPVMGVYADRAVNVSMRAAARLFERSAASVRYSRPPQSRRRLSR